MSDVVSLTGTDSNTRNHWTVLLQAVLPFYPSEVHSTTLLCHTITSLNPSGLIYIPLRCPLGLSVADIVNNYTTAPDVPIDSGKAEGKLTRFRFRAILKDFKVHT
jgi:hypothetical protein